MFGQRHKDLSPIVPSLDTPILDSDGEDPSYNLVVISDGNSDTQLTAALAPLTHIKDISQCQNLRIVLSPDLESERPVSIPFIDCDYNATTINTLIEDIQREQMFCGVFYSGTEAGCMVASDQEWFKDSIPNLFTVTTTATALQMVSMLTVSAELRGTISMGTKSNSSNNSSGGLIALYAALGVFAFALLIVLIGGIVRICRHPERYNTDGTGEERARGLARAMLDSVPLVRVDNSQNPTRESGIRHDEEYQIEHSQEKQSNRPTSRRVSNNRSNTSNNSSNNGGTPETGPEGSSEQQSGTQNTNTEHNRKELIVSTVNDAPLPAVLSAPAPTKVNTYALSAGIRTPQCTPGHTPRSPTALVSPNTDAPPPKYSTDGFPFPIMHDQQPNSSLETIQEHKIATKPHTGRSTPQLAGSSLGQSPMRTLTFPSQTQTRDIACFTEKPVNNLELPTKPPTRHRKVPLSSSAAAATPKNEQLSINTTRKDETKCNSPAIGVYVNHDDDVCSICFEKFQTGELLRALPCSHHFHATCVDPWLLKSSSKCPLCRTDLRKNTESNEKTGSSRGLGHTFHFAKQRIRRLSESLMSDSRSETRLDQEDSEMGRTTSTDRDAATRFRHVPSLRRSNTAPAHRLLRLLPITPSTVHLLRSNRQAEPESFIIEESNRVQPTQGEIIATTQDPVDAVTNCENNEKGA